MLPLEGDREWEKYLRDFSRMLVWKWMRLLIWINFYLGLLLIVATAFRGYWRECLEAVAWVGLVSLFLIYPPKILPKDPS